MEKKESTKKKDKWIVVRVTGAEKEAIQKVAKKRGTTVAQLVMGLINQ